MPAPAFSAPLPPSLHHPITTLTPQTRRPIPCTKLPNRRAKAAKPPLCLARGRIDPRDEAFITFPSCGSDTPISARAVTAQGSMPVRCGGCGGRVTARAEDALTITGEPLAGAASPREEEGDPGAGVVDLYIGGLGPKTDSAALKAALEEFGRVTKAKVVHDRATGRSRGFGFASIVGRSAASAATDVLSGGSTRLGRRVTVREARER